MRISNQARSKVRVFAILLAALCLLPLFLLTLANAPQDSSGSQTPPGAMIKPQGFASIALLWVSEENRLPGFHTHNRTQLRYIPGLPGVRGLAAGQAAATVLLLLCAAFLTGSITVFIFSRYLIIPHSIHAPPITR